MRGVQEISERLLMGKFGLKLRDFAKFELIFINAAQKFSITEEQLVHFKSC